MYFIAIQNLEEELTEAMQLQPLRGLSLQTALNVAKREHAFRLRNWQLWAANPTNEKALDNAAKLLAAVDYVVRVLEAGIAAQQGTCTTKAPCPFYSSVKRVYAIARDLGLDTKAEDKMRAAFGRFIGKDISSRAQLTGGEWSMIGTAIKCGELAW